MMVLLSTRIACGNGRKTGSQKDALRPKKIFASAVTLNSTRFRMHSAEPVMNAGTVKEISYATPHNLRSIADRVRCSLTRRAGAGSASGTCHCNINRYFTGYKHDGDTGRTGCGRLLLRLFG